MSAVPPTVESAEAAATTEDAGAQPASDVGQWSRLVQWLSRWTVVIGFVVMVLLFTALKPSTFFTLTTLKNVFDQSAVPVILVAGLTFVLAAGEFDLSFTATIGMCAAIVVVLMAHDGLSVALACLLTLLAGLVAGVGVGWLVTAGRASSFIVTLAIGSVFTGIELAITGSNTIYSGIPSVFGKLTADHLLGLYLPDWLAVIIVIYCAVLLHGTRFGRHVTAIGGNPVAAYLGGVRIRRVRVLCFVLVSVFAAFAGIILTSRAVSYYPNSSAGFLLSAYAAVFLGAAAGWRTTRFTIPGSVFGVVWLITLQTGLTYVNASAWLNSLMQGLVLLVAVLLAQRGRRVTT